MDIRKLNERLEKDINESTHDANNLIYDFILENELCTEGELDMACDVGGFNTETLNYVICRQTGYHDIEQLWACGRESYYFNDEIIEHFQLEDENEEEEE